MWITERLQCFACACVAAVAVVLSVADPAGAAAWLIQPTPHLTRGYSGLLDGVSCTSSRACTAVGWYENAETDVIGPALAQRWDGTRWSIQPTPGPPGTTESSLDDVSCTSSTACTAVGSYFVSEVGEPLAEHWDGASWWIQPIPNSRGQLYGVSCTSSTACTAVGDFSARWDGTAWSIQPTRNSAGSPTDVSCTSSTACTGVGFSDLYRWDGTRWSVQPSPSPRPPAGGQNVGTRLSDVSCTSSTACTAVGNYHYEEYEQQGDYSYLNGVQLTLAERWNGKRWSIQATPDPSDSTEVELLGVSCTSSIACVAVGDYVAREGRVTFAERWDGKGWSIQPTPNPSGSQEAKLESVSCTSGTACTAVGESLAGVPVYPGVYRPLVEHLTPTTPARAKLTGIPAACVRAAFTARITGVGIASVRWWVDGRRISGRTVHRGTRYAASVLVRPGRHGLTARVTFVRSSHAAPRTFRKTINGCPPSSTGLG